MATVMTVLIVMLTALPASPQDVSSVDVVLERMAGAYQSLETLGAELQQIKSYPQLGLTDPPEIGLVYLKRKAGGDLLVRLEIREPEKRIVTVKDGGHYMLYQPKIKQAIEGRVAPSAGSGSGTSFVSYFLGDLTAAKKDYDISSLGEESIGAHRTIHLQLNAKPGGKGYYPRIDLWVDTELWVPVQQEFVEPNRSVTRIQFEGIQINREIKDSLFTVKLPPDVERVRG
jgi:outer membrane lipoprotein-sorting protein